MALKDVDLKLDLDTKTIAASINRATGSFEKFSKDIKRSMFRAGKHIDNLSGNLKTMGFAAVGAGAVVGGAFAFIAKDAIDLASDLEETQGKFDIVFNGMTDVAEKWSTTLQNAYILNQTESKKYLSSLQDLLVPTGMAREEAGALSFEFVKLAADLASFNNMDTAAVVLDITSALQGSSETMAKYGVNVKVAKIEQEILNQGWVKSKKDITDAMKAQALMNITLRQTKDAQGDIARTSESYANQMRLAKKNVNDLSTAFGQGLVPAVNEAVKSFNRIFSENDVEEWGRKSALAVLEFAAATADGINSVYKIFSNLNGILRVSESGFLMLTKGIQYLFEQSNKLFGNTEQAEYWARAQVDAQRMIEDAMGKASEAFDNAEKGIPGLEKVANKIRQIKTEVEKPAAGGGELVGGVKEAEREVVKLGDTWTTVNKNMTQTTTEETSRFKDEYGRTWGELEADAGKSIEDILKELKAVRKETEKPYTMKFTKEGSSDGGNSTGYVTGGKVFGEGGVDKVPAMLTAGEFVIKKPAVDKFGYGIFHALNNMRMPELPRFAAGGPVLARAGNVPINQSSGKTVTVNFAFPGVASKPQGVFEEGMVNDLLGCFERAGLTA